MSAENEDPTPSAQGKEPSADPSDKNSDVHSTPKVSPWSTRWSARLSRFRLTWPGRGRSSRSEGHRTPPRRPVTTLDLGVIFLHTGKINSHTAIGTMLILFGTAGILAALLPDVLAAGRAMLLQPDAKALCHFLLLVVLTLGALLFAASELGIRLGHP